jgi:hypothetical protein
MARQRSAISQSRVSIADHRAQNAASFRRLQSLCNMPAEIDREHDSVGCYSLDNAVLQNQTHDSWFAFNRCGARCAKKMLHNVSNSSVPPACSALLLRFVGCLASAACSRCECISLALGIVECAELYLII